MRIPVSVSQICAVVAGNALDFYDFLTYSFFAVQIGQAFFPSSNSANSLLASLATFGAGFFTRPVGALVLGHLADRIGRRPAMLLSFALMGFAVVGLALTPPYRNIGIVAPILAVVFRLVQGFALGGEVGPSTAFLIEVAPPKQRGVFVSFQTMGQGAAILCTGLIGISLANIMGLNMLSDFGWRIAFLIGASVIPFGLLLRSGFYETLHGHDATLSLEQRDSRKPQLDFRLMTLAMMLLTSATTTVYVLLYLTTYATATLHMSTKVAFGANVITGAIGLCLSPIGGWLSDRYGRKVVMIIPMLLNLVLIVPCFYVISHFRTAPVLFCGTAILAAMLSISTAAILVTITESIPKRVRSRTLGVVYALTIAVFGGTAQFNVAWLTNVTHNPVAPAWYAAAAIVIGLVAMLIIRIPTEDSQSQ